MFFSGRRRLHDDDLQLICGIGKSVNALLERTNTIMSQLDDLVSGLQALQSDLDNLETELQNAQNNAPSEVDLTPALDLVSSMRSRLETTQTVATDTSNSSSNITQATDTSGDQSAAGTETQA